MEARGALVPGRPPPGHARPRRAQFDLATSAITEGAHLDRRVTVGARRNAGTRCKQPAGVVRRPIHRSRRRRETDETRATITTMLTSSMCSLTTPEPSAILSIQPMGVWATALSQRAGHRRARPHPGAGAPSTIGPGHLNVSWRILAHETKRNQETVPRSRRVLFCTVCTVATVSARSPRETEAAAPACW